MAIATVFKCQRGVSTIELLVGAGLTAVVFLGLSNLDQNQQKALKGMNHRMDSQVMSLSAQKVMTDENSCTVTMLAAGNPPDMSVPHVLPAIKKSYYLNGWQSNVILEKGKKYGQSLLSNIVVRPFDSTKDETPGHKIVLEFTRQGEGLGAETIIKTLPFFYDNVPADSSPGVNFRCSTTPPIKMESALVSSPKTVIQCDPSGTPMPKQTRVNCPSGTRALTCGILDQNSSKDEDKVTCYLAPDQQACLFSHEISGGCDTIHGFCYCM